MTILGRKWRWIQTALICQGFKITHITQVSNNSLITLGNKTTSHDWMASWHYQYMWFLWNYVTSFLKILTMVCCSINEAKFVRVSKLSNPNMKWSSLIEIMLCFCWQFATKAYVVCAAMQALDMDSMSEQPDTYPSNATKEEKVEWVTNIATAIVNRVWLAPSKTYLMSTARSYLSSQAGHNHTEDNEYTPYCLCQKGNIAFDT